MRDISGLAAQLATEKRIALTSLPVPGQLRLRLARLLISSGVLFWKDFADSLKGGVKAFDAQMRGTLLEFPTTFSEDGTSMTLTRPPFKNSTLQVDFDSQQGSIEMTTGSEFRSYELQLGYKSPNDPASDYLYAAIHGAVVGQSGNPGELAAEALTLFAERIQLTQ